MRRLAGILHLITPHGDWKPVAGSGAQPQRVHSLPLMGIGNFLFFFVHNLDLQRLITPHGDWKPRAQYRGCRVKKLITPHGDWKRFGHFPLAIRAQALITPHGDWKPRLSRSGPMGPRRTHYPSWGLETLLLLRGKTPDLRPHYPSWGLETTAAAAIGSTANPSHYPSWGLETLDS